VTCLYYCLFIYDLFIELFRGYSVVYGLDGTRFQSKQWQEIFLFHKTVNAGSRTHAGSRSMGAAVLSRRYGGRDVKLTGHLRPVSKFRMSGTLPLLPLYAFTARTGITSPLTFCLFVNDVVSSSDYTASKMTEDISRINWRMWNEAFVTEHEVIPRNLPRNTEERQENVPVAIGGVTVGILTKHLLKTSQLSLCQ